MATLWIRQFTLIGEAPASVGRGTHPLQIADEPGTDLTPVTYTTAVASAAFAAGMRYITIISDAAFHYVCGAAPVATTAHLKIPANTPWTIGITAGHKISVVLGV